MKTAKETPPSPPSRSAAQRAAHKAHPASAGSAGTGAPFDEEPVQARRKAPAVAQLNGYVTGNARAKTWGQSLTTSRDNNVNARESATAADFMHAHREARYHERHEAEVARRDAARRDQAAGARTTAHATATASTGLAPPTSTAISLDTRITAQNRALIGCGDRWIGHTVRELAAEIRKQIAAGKDISPPRAIAEWVYKTAG